MTASDVDIRWANSGDLPLTGRFLSRVVAQDPAYISHGEIQAGLSPDGLHWSPDLEALALEDLAADDPELRVAIARDVRGVIVGAAVVREIATRRVHYVVIEDLAVDPQERSHGLGAMIVRFVEDAARNWGARWSFLESGLHNESAHRFFERHGYGAISKVFAKTL